jgi:hypothetical protein
MKFCSDIEFTSSCPTLTNSALIWCDIHNFCPNMVQSLKVSLADPQQRLSFAQNNVGAAAAMTRHTHTTHRFDVLTCNHLFLDATVCNPSTRAAVYHLCNRSPLTKAVHSSRSRVVRPGPWAVLRSPRGSSKGPIQGHSTSHLASVFQTAAAASPKPRSLVRHSPMLAHRNSHRAPRTES